MTKLEIDYMEYSSDALAQADYISDDSSHLQVYAESVIKTQGNYSLKVVADTSSIGLNLKKLILPSIDLSGVNDLKFDIRSNRTGQNIKLRLIKQAGGGIGTGGTITYDGLYTIHTFLTNDNFVATGNITTEILAVGGGGGGGGGASSGGGGGGGVAVATNFLLNSGTFPVVVGVGGNGGSAYGNGSNGTNSTISTITAVGGGAGSSDRAGHPTGYPGGCGGGGASTGTPLRAGGATTQTSGTGWTGYGFKGGDAVISGAPYPGGGGGGAGGAGSNSVSGGAGANGGNGRVSSITGTATYYGGGGGGSERVGNVGQGIGGLGGGGNASLDSPAGAGVNGLGGGGGGIGSGGAGARGGNGVVIIKYLTPSSELIKEFIPNIIIADEWQTIRLNISDISNTIKSTVSKIEIEIINDDAENIFYIDNFEVAQAIDIFGVI